MSFIFLSYAREDLKRAEEIAGLMSERGVPVWMDRFRLLPGQRWDAHIRVAIKTCAGAVFLASRHSLSKETYIQEEIDALAQRAEAMGDDTIFLMIVRLEDVPISDPKLQAFHWVDYFEGSPPDEFLKVIQSTWNAEEEAERRGDAAAEKPGQESEYVPARGTTGRVFMPNEVDLFANKKTKETYIFHGKVIDYNISHLVYVPEDHSVIVVMNDGTRLDLGVKLQWLVRPYFLKAREVFIVRTEDKKSVDGTVVPLRLGVAGTDGAVSLPNESRLGRFFKVLDIFRKSRK